MKKITNEEFIEKAKLVHNDKYDYSLVNYTGNKIKIKIVCIKHGFFEQTPNSHLVGQGCPVCGKINKSKNKILTINKFKEKAQLVHGNKYNYSLVDYRSYEEKVKIICPVHGEFEQTPHSHLNGSGCQECGGVLRFSTEEFIKKANEIHENKYDYSLVNYSKIFKKIQIMCPKHGIFEQTPNSHINQKSGCPRCAGQNKTTEEFIKESEIIHGFKYDYSLVNYVKTKNKIKIICSEHGEFEQTPNRHLFGDGCPICRESKGENRIREWLNSNSIEFIRQYKFINCKNVRPLPFDFYLPKYNCCIEYDGEQHFKIKKHWGGINGFVGIQNRDRVKTEYCNDNNIKLIRIPYNTNIYDKLICLNEL